MEETWRPSPCDVYIFMLMEGDAFIRHANVSHYHVSTANHQSPRALWNYHAYYIILLFHSGNATLNPSDVAKLYNLRKTEKLLILQQRENHLVAWTHQLYSTSTKLTFLDIWSGGKFRRGGNLFPEKLVDMEGAVLRVATFDHPPSVVYARDDHQNIVSRLGIDIKVVETLAKARNFSVEYIEISQEEMWGFELPNGTWVGLVGIVHYELADIGSCNLFLETHHSKKVDYSTPYNFDRGCFVAPAPKPLSSWKSPVMPFTWDTWSSVVVALGVGGGLLYLVAALSLSPESAEFRSLSYDYLYILGALTMHSLKIVPLNAPMRVYMGFVWLFGLIVATAYSANLVAFLSFTPMSTPINTLIQVSKSGLSIGSHPFWKAQFAESTDPVVHGFTNVLRTDLNFHYLFDAVEDGKFALIESINYINFEIRTRFTYSSHASIRVVPECLMPYSIGLALQKNSPLKSHLDRLILQLFESGVNYKWQEEAVAYIRAQYTSKRPHTKEESRSKPLNMAQLQGVFYIFVVLCLLSALILATEIAVASRGCCNTHPQHAPAPEMNHPISKTI
ncbi:glutamate receptor ionotropic, delta-1-like [Procambarus clarkii]|uniref:glutamate receptor ionotropic, delta-1-like n=1 Tax=Procambarus clarkii TaxID=6728 RepID=UPI001E676A0A|nr:glutamate receptor ionotropic, delta-1-like [Procambarus clarkii]